MKYLILSFIFLFPFLVFADYNGVHVEFNIQLLDGTEIHGFKFIAPGQFHLEFQAELESSPDLLLKNNYTNEPGVHGYYQQRIQYNYGEGTIYRIINPVSIDLNIIKSIAILELIVASYAVQIVGDYQLKDSIWMNTEPIFHYWEDENMCTYDIFIHKSGDVPLEVLGNINAIIDQSELEIKKKEKELDDFDGEYGELMKEICQKRNRLIKDILEKNKNLKTVVLSMCSC